MEKGELFAHVNDSIRRLGSEGPGTESWQFICECADVTCHELVTLTLLEFDEHRAAWPPEPIVVSEHAAWSHVDAGR